MRVCRSQERMGADLIPLQNSLKTFFFYFRNERENALLSVIEETRHDTFESAERQHWDAVSSEWEADKMRILTALSGANASEAATESFLPRKEQTRIHETTLGNLCHSMARVNPNKSEELVTNTTEASKYIPKRSRICINQNPLFQTSLHKIFKNCFL